MTLPWTQTCNCYSCDVCRDDGRTEILTKGDNNPVDDRGLYNPGQLWLEPSDIMGRAKGYVKRTHDVACLRYAHVINRSCCCIQLSALRRHGDYQADRSSNAQIRASWHHGSVRHHRTRVKRVLPYNSEATSVALARQHLIHGCEH